MRHRSPATRRYKGVRRQAAEEGATSSVDEDGAHFRRPRSQPVTVVIVCKSAKTQQAQCYLTVAMSGSRRTRQARPTRELLRPPRTEGATDARARTEARYDRRKYAAASSQAEEPDLKRSDAESASMVTSPSGGRYLRSNIRGEAPVHSVFRVAVFPIRYDLELGSAAVRNLTT